MTEARPNRIYAVCWTWRKHRIVKTQVEGRRLVKRWKTWHERCGWKLRTSGPDTYIALNEETGEERSVALHTYDAQTRERIWWKPPKPRIEKPKTTVHRRGRKPVGV